MSPFFGSTQSVVRFRSSITPFTTKAANTKNLTKNFSSFEKLPLELRQQVYGYLGYEIPLDFVYVLQHIHKPAKTNPKLRFWYDLLDNTLLKTPRSYQEVQVETNRLKCPNPHPALLLVCQLITGDLYALTYSKSIFSINYDLSAALERSPEKSPFTLGTRTLSYLTHVLLGPIQVPGCNYRDSGLLTRQREPIYDAERLPALITSVHLISRHCRHLELLGVGLWNLDVIRSKGLLPTLTKALCSAVRRLAHLKWVFIGIGFYTCDSFDLEVLEEEGAEGKTEQLTKWAESMWSSFMDLTEDHHRAGVPQDE